MTKSVDSKSGLVVAGFGRQVLVEDSDRQRFVCRMKGRKIRPVCGDQISWTPLTDDDVDGVVIKIHERRNTLCRPNRQGHAEPVASNLDRLLIVFACQRPPADPFLIDRYIAAAEHIGIESVLVYNKIDLDDQSGPDWLTEFSDLGYQLIKTSAKSGLGIDQLRDVCGNGLNMLVGQSGVGKSTIINALIPGIDQQTGELSDSGRFGRHTTSASYLYHLQPELPDSGALIDTPGVRDFAPPPLSEQQVPSGYREIIRAAMECRFGNCTHTHEPRCEVKQQVDDGKISQRRYESYLKLLSLMRNLSELGGYD